MSNPQDPYFDPYAGDQYDSSAPRQADPGSFQAPNYGQIQPPSYGQAQSPDQLPAQSWGSQPAGIPSYAQIPQAPYPPYPPQDPYAAGPTGYAPVPSYQAAPVAYAQPKSLVAAALLAFFLGGLGIHNFYLGRTGRGVAQLVLTLVGWATSWLIIGWFLLIPVAIWVLVEFILILCRSGSYGADSRGVPLA